MVGLKIMSINIKLHVTKISLIRLLHAQEPSSSFGWLIRRFCLSFMISQLFAMNIQVPPDYH
jgi:hypothetical protein